MEIMNHIKMLINKICFREQGKESLILQKGAKYNNCCFEGMNLIGVKSELYNVNMGYASYVGRNVIMAYTEIGKYSCIGPYVKVVQGAHPTKKFVSLHPSFYSLQKQCGFTYIEKQKFNEINYIDVKNKISVKIGNDVWIGADVIILQGVTIGNGAIVAAGSVVAKDVEPYSIVAGVPAKRIRYRFEAEKIQMLEYVHWWDKPEKWIKDNADKFEDIDCFLKIWS